MKIFQIENELCHYDMTPLYTNAEEARKYYPASLLIVDAPDFVFEGWGYDKTRAGEDRFIKPIPPEGWLYDDNTGTFYNPASMKAKEIRELKIKLSETDYQIIKCSEYQLMGLELPYDIQTLHTERQSLRDEINRLEAELNV